MANTAFSAEHISALRFGITYFAGQVLGIKNYHMSDGSDRPIFAVMVENGPGQWSELRIWPKARLGEGQALPSEPVDLLCTFGAFEQADGSLKYGQPKYIGWIDPATGEKTLLSGEEYAFEG